ncbi:hypothetical protein HW555_009739 [Spodoptera exigua]|uniref:Uncharacterized protein n=1 Tax=Spodoptera exigua TaxID=7107 RepID=A0A835GAP9_SPOEX|nr:hypothetical protein HW555_009739 [Spodoptera exigua]
MSTAVPVPTWPYYHYQLDIFMTTLSVAVELGSCSRPCNRDTKITKGIYPAQNQLIVQCSLNNKVACTSPAVVGRVKNSYMTYRGPANTVIGRITVTPDNQPANVYHSALGTNNLELTKAVEVIKLFSTPNSQKIASRSNF